MGYKSIEEAREAIRYGILAGHLWFEAKSWVWKPRVGCPCCKSLKHANCGVRKCFKCGQEGHETKNCSATKYCTTCGGDHAARECSEYKNKMSEALNNKRATYAEVLKQKNDPNKKYPAKKTGIVHRSRQVEAKVEIDEKEIEERVTKMVLEQMSKLLPMILRVLHVDVKMADDDFTDLIRGVMLDVETGVSYVSEDDSEGDDGEHANTPENEEIMELDLTKNRKTPDTDSQPKHQKKSQKRKQMKQTTLTGREAPKQIQFGCSCGKKYSGNHGWFNHVKKDKHNFICFDCNAAVSPSSSGMRAHRQRCSSKTVNITNDQ